MHTHAPRQEQYEAQGAPGIDWSDCPVSAHARPAQSQLLARLARDLGVMPSRVVLADRSVGAVRVVRDRSGAHIFMALSMGFHGIWDVRSLYPTQRLLDAPQRPFGLDYRFFQSKGAPIDGFETLAGPVSLYDLTLLYTALEAGDYGFIPERVGLSTLQDSVEREDPHHILCDVVALQHAASTAKRFADIRPLLAPAIRAEISTVRQ